MVRRSLMLAFVLVTLSAWTSAKEPLRIRVLSYNVHHGEGVDRKLDLTRIAKVIQSVHPDVVALQEVDRKTMRTGRVDQPAVLARLTGMSVVFEKNIDYQGGQYGNAVLSKLPIVKHKNVHLPRLDQGEQRGVLICELEPKASSTRILFLNTHLDHRADDGERLASAARINALVSDRGELPALLAGDLNATRDSSVLARFAQHWKTASRKELPTVPVGAPRRQIDFILSRPAGRWKPVEVRVLDEAIASDHRAIFAVFELTRAGDPSKPKGPFGSVQCAGDYRHHLQGVCTDEKDAIFWSFTTELVRTNREGKVLHKIPVPNHHGDLCFHKGKLYVAVNLGKFNDPQGNADSWVYVYDARSLKRIDKHPAQEVFHGAGGIGVMADSFYVVGGLPDGVRENYVYQYDARFRFQRKHVIASGWTRLGIQTATFHDGAWWFGCYGSPAILLKTDKRFQMLGRYEFDGSLGLVGAARNRLLVAKGPRTDQGRCLGSLHVARPDEENGLVLLPDKLP